MRNEKLARECSRLKIENRSLKIFLRKLLKQELNLKIDEGKAVEDKAVQTETSKTLFRERMIRHSPPLTNVTSISEWLEFQSPISSLRSPSSISLPFTIDDKENPVPPLPKTYSDFGKAPSPHMGGHSDAKVITPSTDVKGPRPATPLRTPPKKLGMTATGLPEKVGIKVPETTREPTPTPLASMTASRESRAVSRVGSYKEPSLKAKVRKGFKFFQFLGDEK